MRIINITDLSAPELDIYARMSENQLAHIYEPASGLFIAESPKVIERALDAGYEPVSILLEDRHVEGQCTDIIKRCGDIPIYTAPFPHEAHGICPDKGDAVRHEEGRAAVC